MSWGEPVAARTSLLGEIFTPVQAHALGMVRELIPAAKSNALVGLANVVSMGRRSSPARVDDVVAA